MTEAGRKIQLEHMGSVKFRSVAKARVEGSAGYRNSYGLTLPKDAIVRLGWRPGDRVEVWFDEVDNALVLHKLEVKPPLIAV